MFFFSLLEAESHLPGVAVVALLAHWLEVHLRRFFLYSHIMKIVTIVWGLTMLLKYIYIYISHYHLIELGLDGHLLVTRRTGEVVDTPSLKVDFQITTTILSRK